MNGKMPFHSLKTLNDTNDIVTLMTPRVCRTSAEISALVLSAYAA